MFLHSEGNDNIGMIYIKSVIRGILLSVVLLVIGALIFYFSNLNNDYIQTFIWIVTIISICYAGIYGSYKIGKRGFIHGAVIGVLYMVILAVIAILAEKGQLNVRTYTITFIMSLVIGSFSGMIGVTLSSKE